MAAYKIKVTKSGVPVEDAEVMIHGVGVEDTNSRGQVSITATAAQTKIQRGARYAARVGKPAGSVATEPIPFRVTINYSGGAAGPQLMLVPDVEYVYDLDEV